MQKYTYSNFPYFIPGHLYKRSKLHDEHGGNRQRGISIPKDKSVIFLFANESGPKYGYKDGWSDDGIYLYTGEGTKGDMEFIGGNKAVLNHVDDGREMHLFVSNKIQGVYRYIDQMVCTGYSFREAPDSVGQTRKAIVFELAPVESFNEQEPVDNKIGLMSLEQLKELALRQSSVNVAPKQRLMNARVRSDSIKQYALARAKGVCESCSNPAPFEKKDGAPYLESHHLRRISDGGPDHPEWVAGICPTCHRRIHNGIDGKTVNERLVETVHQKEGVK